MKRTQTYTCSANEEPTHRHMGDSFQEIRVCVLQAVYTQTHTQKTSLQQGLGLQHKYACLIGEFSIVNLKQSVNVGLSFLDKFVND